MIGFIPELPNFTLSYLNGALSALQKRLKSQIQIAGENAEKDPSWSQIKVSLIQDQDLIADYQKLVGVAILQTNVEVKIAQTQNLGRRTLLSNTKVAGVPQLEELWKTILEVIGKQQKQELPALF